MVQRRVPETRLVGHSPDGRQCPGVFGSGRRKRRAGPSDLEYAERRLLFFRRNPACGKKRRRFGHGYPDYGHSERKRGHPAPDPDGNRHLGKKTSGRHFEKTSVERRPDGPSQQDPSGNSDGRSHPSVTPFRKGGGRLLLRSGRIQTRQRPLWPCLRRPDSGRGEPQASELCPKR